MSDDDTGERTQTMRSLAATLPKVARKVLGRHGLAEGGLITDWPDIVGPAIAERSLPLRLAFAGGERRNGTLLVRVSGPLALELQHLEPQILERLNGYFGYAAVARLKIQQGPVPAPARPRPARPVETGADDGALAGLTAGIEDEPLRKALQGFARALRSGGPRR
jgi:hypothetical protein